MDLVTGGGGDRQGEKKGQEAHDGKYGEISVTYRVPKITHVAIRFRGTIYSLPAPNRHHDVIRHIVETTGAKTVTSLGADQGFIDEDGNYWTRRQALVIATGEGQLKKGSTGPRLRELYSEDVW